MMMVSNIFGFGEMWPKFGGARLPNSQAVFQKAIVDAALTCDRKPHACRAVGVSRDAGPTRGQLSSQRLGAFRRFGQMQGQHSSKISGKPRGRSGASPHQSSGGASPLMTITKTSVPYSKSPLVSL
jgi:hypothetical protein